MGKKSATRFPVARIKKLIQADEDVGKVAQGTPVVVSKALELFLQSLVAECVKDATERGSKKLTAYGLKRTITATPNFDFCTDIVASVPDPITPVDGDKPKRKRVSKPKPSKKDLEAALDKVNDEMDTKEAAEEEGDEKPTVDEEYED